MPDELSDFEQLLKNFQKLAAWGAGGAAVPIAAHLVALSPPWPAGIAAITSTIELISLVFVYQFLKSARKRRVNRVLIASAIILAVSGLGYLMLNSIYTFEVPTTKERFVKGYECTANARAVFKDKCPALDLDDLAKATYEAERLWTAQSIATMRAALVTLWLIVFIALSVVLGSFIVFQSGNSPRPRAKSTVINETKNQAKINSPG